MTYSPTTINTSDHTVNILQLSDLHLYLDSTKIVNGINCYQSFKDCLQQALDETIRCDLILVTGDLVAEIKPEIYDRTFTVLEQTNLPYACIAGNHDVTDEIGKNLPFKLRQLVACKADSRLLSRYCISANNWKILLMDSSIQGEVGGRISYEDLAWLHQILEQNCEPILIAMHHHIMPIGSKWIDEHVAEGAEDFWRLIETYPQVKAIASGHVHQQHTSIRTKIKSYSCPSTCYQFKPNQPDFCVDKQAKPGYRWLQLKADGKINSWVNRLADKMVL